MKYRLRFVIIHTLVISGILLAAMASIYFLDANNRRTDFQNSLLAQGYSSFFSFHNVSPVDGNITENVNEYLSGNLDSLSVVIFNDSEQEVYSRKAIAENPITPILLQKVKSAGIYYFNHGIYECAGIYYKSAGISGYTIISAYDKYGISRLKNLSLIMIIVTLAAIIIVGLFSFVYVINVTKPLVRLSIQMRHLNENNLKEKFDIGKAGLKNNEMGFIAANFNGMLERLIKAFDMQKTFVHHASHELRTPLAVMLAQTESALRKDLSPADSRKVLLSLKEDQQEMIELTNSLLLLSQYEQSDSSAGWPLVRLDEVLYDTIEMIKRGLRNINISVEFDKLPEDELHLSIHGNEILLRSAFRNLIKNAYQYSEDKNVSIIISIEEKSIKIHFDNKGILVSEQEQSQLFIPFFRSISVQHKKGFGLGLSIVKRIIMLHKGVISYSICNTDTNRFTISFSTSVDKK